MKKQIELDAMKKTVDDLLMKRNELQIRNKFNNTKVNEIEIKLLNEMIEAMNRVASATIADGE